eukprot:2926634-Karenia_brevis.AAC.1
MKDDFIPIDKTDQYINFVKDRKAELNTPAAPVMPVVARSQKRGETLAVVEAELVQRGETRATTIAIINTMS